MVNDIALLKLKRNVVTEQGSTAAPVCVRPVSTNIDDNFPIDNTAFAAGWGYIEEEGMATQIIAKEVALPLVEDDICEAEYKDKAGQWGWLTNGSTGDVLDTLMASIPITTRTPTPVKVIQADPWLDLMRTQVMSWLA